MSSNIDLDVSILIVSFNTRQITLACLRSVIENIGDLSAEIIVIDNASKDGSAEAIAQGYPTVKVIALEENIGFAAANNLAAKHANGRYLLLLNPDTVVLDQAIQKIVAFADAHPEAGIFGGRTFFEDGSLNYTSCHGFPAPWSVFCIASGLSRLFPRSGVFDPESLGRWQRDTVRQVDAVTGCFMLIRRQVWDTLGGFDKSFFMYGEETDFCWRARKLGIICLICPDARIIHYGGRSESTQAEKMLRLFRAKALLFRKHWRKRAVWFGILMLELWAFTRMLGYGVLRLVSASYQPMYDTWRQIWRRRYQFKQPIAPVCSHTISDHTKMPRIIAIASGGGHWVELLRMRPAFEGCQVTYVTTIPGYRSHVDGSDFFVVRDATRWNKIGLLVEAIQILRLILKVRPDIVITTGAAPGYFAVRFGKMLGAKTIWIDSIANADELSLSGKKAGRFADLWLTQWPHLARPDGPQYCGSVL